MWVREETASRSSDEDCSSRCCGASTVRVAASFWRALAAAPFAVGAGVEILKVKRSVIAFTFSIRRYESGLPIL
jgi:hypothetical protein